MIDTTTQHLIQVAREKHISKWTASECAVCDYPIHYLIRSENEVLLDPGCHCSDKETMRTKYVKSSWQDLVDFLATLVDEQEQHAKEFWNIK